jgi:Trk K+ transport system NAD-binding subunit
MNSLGRILVERLAERGDAVLAVDSDAAKLRELACPTLVGNAEDVAVLEEAGLARARLLVSTLQIVDTNQLLAYRARSYGVPASIHAFDPSLVAELRTIGVSHLMLSKHQGIRRLAHELQLAGILHG